MKFNKINCQIVNILLNDDNEFTNKYTSFINGNYNFDNILEEYFENKNMRAINIDRFNQSLCFTNPKEKISFYNQNSKKNESYFEEVHIHCNNLFDFDSFVNYLEKSEYKNFIDYVDTIPHYTSVRDELKNSELLIEPMTNEVSATRNLVTILSQKNDENIFRALAIHFGKLIDNPKDIDIDLIHKLNDIYHHDVLNNDDIFFSSVISDKLIDITNEDKEHNKVIKSVPSQKNNYNNGYSISIDEQYYEM